MKRKYTQQELDTMCDNLFWKLRKSVLYHGSHSCVTVSYLFEKVMKYAPKTIKACGCLVKDIVVRLWSVDHDYSIENCEIANVDLNLPILTLNYFIIEAYLIYICGSIDGQYTYPYVLSISITVYTYTKRHFYI